MLLLPHNESITPSSALQMNHCPYGREVSHTGTHAQFACSLSAAKLSLT